MGGVAKGIAFMECEHLREVVLNEGLQVIGKEAFDCCKSLTSITFPSTVISVDQSFFRCKSLKKVVLNEGLQSIGWKSFSDCPSLESITIPSTVVEIGQAAFCSCINMKEVVFNDGLKKIGRASFSGCTSLESISLPCTLTEIHHRAFSGCSNLREVEFNSEGLQTITYDVFGDCTSLERFVFPIMSTRLNNISQAVGQFDVVNDIDPIRGPLEWKDGELFVTSQSIYVPKTPATSGNGHDWIAVRQSLDRITSLVAYYEKKEATTLIELALWKANIELNSAINREACRIDVPGPVKETLLQCLSFKDKLPGQLTCYYDNGVKNSVNGQMEYYEEYEDDY